MPSGTDDHQEKAVAFVTNHLRAFLELDEPRRPEEARKVIAEYDDLELLEEPVIIPTFSGLGINQLAEEEKP